jgi:hypothetical protein
MIAANPDQISRSRQAKTIEGNEEQAKSMEMIR